jgi:hypothetical protein
LEVRSDTLFFVIIFVKSTLTKIERMKIRHVLLLQLLIVANLSFSQTPTIGFQTRETFKTSEAKQGVAVDADCFYTINSTGIGKYDKKTGSLLLTWQDTTGDIIHIDGGVVLKDKLFCAHSNYPGIPMTGSIEIFSTKDLKHSGSHSFGIRYGSCTWADFHDNTWWVCFAHYDQFRKETGKGTEWTVLVRFDTDWHEKESWTFPQNVISELKPMSASGGSWGPDGYLYITGHDSSKVYVLKLPQSGSVLQYVQSAKIGSHGQGIAWDRSEKNVLYGIIRKDNSVVVSELARTK